MPIPWTPVFNQFICFTGVGAIGTASHYGVLFLLVEGIALHPVIASAIGFMVGAVVNYHLNRAYTFQSTVPHLLGFSKFFAVATAGLILNTLIMLTAISILRIHYVIAQIIATGVVLIWNFLGNRMWTFKDAPKGSR